MKEYEGKPLETLRRNNFLVGKTNQDYTWNGVEGIFLTALRTPELEDYNRGQNPATGSRYGTPYEVEDDQQYLPLRKDRSKPLTVDKGNFREAKFQKTVGRVVKKFQNDRVIPEMVRYTLDQWATNAGQYKTITDDDDGSKILFDLLQIETAYTNAYIPEKNRFVAVDANLFPYIRSALTNLDNVTDRMLFKGVVGRIGTLNIIEVPHGDMPADCWMLAWWEDAVLNPVTFKTLDVHETPENMDGSLINYHVRYDAFVIGEYANGVVAVLAASKRATAIAASNARVINPGGKTVKYTTDGSDPRYSASAVTITGSSNITVPSTDAPVGSTIKTVVYDASKHYPSEVSSTVVAS